MIPICPECSTLDVNKKLTLKNEQLICEECGFVHPYICKEENGMILTEGSLMLDPSAGTVLNLILQNEEDAKDVVFSFSEVLPHKLFNNGKTVKAYKVNISYQLKVYYE